MILRARTVLPITAPSIQNGAVVVSGNKISAVGPWPEIKSKFPGEDVVDLGEMILLPGLINAHCHLDYTNMAGLWLPPKKFTDWIPRMLAAKAEWSYTDYARSWLDGAKMLLQTGTTTVGDIEATPELLPEVWDATPLRIISFLEMTGVRSKREPEKILAEALKTLHDLLHPRCSVALSPHAPYSTSPELLQLCGEVARKDILPVAIHVAESDQEFEMFTYARGEMHDWLKKNGRDNTDCGRGTPVQHLEKAGLLGKNVLAIHANYLDEDDFGLLAKRKASVVHCPRSHLYFSHQPFLLDKLVAAKVNVCLGTDSLATVTKTGKEKLALNLFEEMQLLARARPKLPPKNIARMATVNGAKALGRAGRIGQISQGAFADLIALPHKGKTRDIYETVVHHASTIAAGMIDGQWTIAP
ncbi:MAG TPA: amidohydrolase family protein [Verrucomicrobiae bacterium]|jgi:cytosine/adenosine deaminase-related metal-dependent hydrolase